MCGLISLCQKENEKFRVDFIVKSLIYESSMKHQCSYAKMQIMKQKSNDIRR